MDWRSTNDLRRKKNVYTIYDRCYDVTNRTNTMTNIILGINLFLMVFLWRCATTAFEDGKNTIGWIDIFFSAFNGAAVANALTQGTV